MAMGTSGRFAALFVIMVAAILGGCQDIRESADFERHRHSRLFQPYDRPDVIFFDVRFSPDFPAGAAAEATRQAWLAQWLRQRGLCPGGHEVVEQRPFAYEEDNPGRYDQRYRVRCRDVADPAPG
jgi:hypothetical protein